MDRCFGPLQRGLPVSTQDLDECSIPQGHRQGPGLCRFFSNMHRPARALQRLLRLAQDPERHGIIGQAQDTKILANWEDMRMGALSVVDDQPVLQMGVGRGYMTKIE